MEKINDLLNYKLKIVQNDDYFKFSIDTVLLANFIKLNGHEKVIDFCTGNAPIPLILSSKLKEKITGVELQKEIYNLAQKSVKENGLENKIEILNKDVKEISSLYETDTFDVVTCNPPYFKLADNNLIATNKIKAIARHEIEITLNDIFVSSRKILKNNGKIYLIHRVERLEEILKLMTTNNLQPKVIRFIYPRIDSNASMVLIEGSKNGKPGLKVAPPCIIYDHNDYSKEIKSYINGG